MKILVPTSGVTPAQETADYVMEIASAISADVLALHAVRPGHSSEAGELCLEIMQNAAKEANVSIECLLRQGPVIDEIIEAAEEQEVSLIVMGASEGFVVERWLSSEVCGNTRVPVVVIPYQVFNQ